MVTLSISSQRVLPGGWSRDGGTGALTPGLEGPCYLSLWSVATGWGILDGLLHCAQLKSKERRVLDLESEDLRLNPGPSPSRLLT